MTERIDLDDFEADESTAEDAKPRGAWFWEGDGDPDAEVDPWTGSVSADADAAAAEDDGTDATTDASPASPASDAGAEDDASTDREPIPRVPRTNEDRPVGIPMESGGSGGTIAGAEPGESGSDTTPAAEPTAGTDGGPAEAVTTTGAAETRTDAASNAKAATSDETAPESAAASTAASSTTPSGPHGGGVDEMTLAFTYNAITRLSHLHGALADANEWTDWIGLVGDVEAYVINKFQRDNHLDLDFFNGSGTGPGERLADIDSHSMFYAERMVVVGVAGEDEYVAEAAGWEFVPLADAAAKAGWDVDD